MPAITYKKSGVDIHRMDAFKQRIRSLAEKSCGAEVLKAIGGFGGFFRFPKAQYRDPVLVSSADGVGTKLKIAVLASRHDTVGIDAVAMNVNDILCTGARPLFLLDYIAFSDLKEDALFSIVKGVHTGCVEAGCALVGGETAQMPGMYKKGEYDIGAFCVGVVEKRNIIDGSGIEVNDTVIGLESSGLHSNGFSLVRKVFSEKALKRMSVELLKPTRIYVKPVLSLLSGKGRGTSVIKGIAHITGGAFYDKIARIIPGDLDVIIEENSWKVPEIFRLIQNKGSIEDKEMYHTLNMGIGMVLITAPGAANRVIAQLARLKLRSWVIGKAVKGRKQVTVE